MSSPEHQSDESERPELTSKFAISKTIIWNPSRLSI